MIINHAVVVVCQHIHESTAVFITDPAGGAYSAPPDPLDGFFGPTSKGGERYVGMGWKGRGGQGRRKEGRREGRKGKG